MRLGTDSYADGNDKTARSGPTSFWISNLLTLHDQQ